MDEFVRESLEDRADQDIVVEIGVSFVSKQNLSTLEGRRWLDGEVYSLPWEKWAFKMRYRWSTHISSWFSAAPRVPARFRVPTALILSCTTRCLQLATRQWSAGPEKSIYSTMTSYFSQFILVITGLWPMLTYGRRLCATATRWEAIIRNVWRRFSTISR